MQYLKTSSQTLPNLYSPPSHSFPPKFEIVSFHVFFSLVSLSFSAILVMEAGLALVGIELPGFTFFQ